MEEKEAVLSESIQNYLKTINKLEDLNGEGNTSEIARELNISSASVTGMLKRLGAMRLVNYNSYKGVTLTEDGKRIALEVIRHHRLLESYLRESLGYKLAQVHDEACKLEHYVSEEFITKVTDILGDPEYDPCGHPIPRKDGELPSREEILLTTLEPIAYGKIASIKNENKELLNYIEESGLIPGKEIILLEKSPYFGPFRIQVDNREVTIGYEVAKMIFVCKDCLKNA
ncbi:MAG: metal-dependent transcriptional regulator [Chloroherpetonaceae bacterium]|jgi:DtxR family Mn-dependent transcriptional regulator|nr:metal-dependent transcriptional regulator [bacterium]